MNYEGINLIITDPCYLLEEENLWVKSNYGDNLSAVGIFDFEVASTMYGDWDCTTYKTNLDPKIAIQQNKKITKDIVGKFCADAGLVCFGPLENVLKINPNFAKWALTHPGCVTVIPNFTGKVNFYTYNDERSVIVESTNQVNLNYYTKQTGA